MNSNFALIATQNPNKGTFAKCFYKMKHKENEKDVFKYNSSIIQVAELISSKNLLIILKIVMNFQFGEIFIKSNFRRKMCYS